MYGRITDLQAISMRLLLACCALGGVFWGAGALAQAPPAAPAATAPAGHTAHQASPAAKTSGTKVSPYRNRGHSDGAAMYTTMNWGVDRLEARSTSSGSLIRFSYHVVDATKAKLLHEKKAEPHMLGLRTHAVLSVPTLENVGALRQTESLQNDRNYWVLFSNKGGYVLKGDRVDVVIGDFYVNGLTVQ
jgi:hypothetical protein